MATAVFLGLLLIILHANASAAQGPVPTGKIKLLLGTATITPPGGATVSLKRGSQLYAGYVVATGGRSFVRVEMLDGTKFTIGKNAEITIDDFAYDEAASIGKFEATVRKGGFEYESGLIGTLSNARRHSFINTPTAIVGIRGSLVKGQVDESGKTTVILETGNADVSNSTGTSSVNLSSEGNTAEVDTQGNTEFQAESTQDQQTLVTGALPTEGEVDEAENEAATEGDGDAVEDEEEEEEEEQEEEEQEEEQQDEEQQDEEQSEDEDAVTALDGDAEQEGDDAAEAEAETTTNLPAPNTDSSILDTTFTTEVEVSPSGQAPP